VPGGRDLDGAVVNARDANDWQSSLYGTVAVEHGRARLTDLAPGPCRIRVSGRGLPDLPVEAVVRAGQEATVKVAVPAGVPVRLMLSAVTEPTPIHVTVAWTRDGEPWERYTNWVEGTVAHAWSRCLLPGSYQVVATSETGRRETSAFIVANGDQPNREIPIRMP